MQMSVLAAGGLLLWLVVRPVYAEEIGWNQAVQETQHSNAELRAAHERFKAARQGVRTSQSERYPQLSASFAYNYGGSSAEGSALTNGSGGKNARGSYNVGLNLSQTIYSGGVTEARIERAKASADLSELNLVQTRAKVTRDLRQAFAAQHYAQRVVKLQDEIRSRRQENLHLVELRYESGSENKGSLLLSEAYLKEANLESLQAKHSLDQAQRDLARILGRDVSTNLTVKNDLPTTNPETNPDFEKLTNENPSLQKMRLDVRSSEADVVLARGGYFPSVSLNGNLGRNDEQFFPKRENWSVGLSVSYPLYNGGRDESSTLGALAQLEATRATEESQRRELSAQLQANFSKLVESKERLLVEQSFAKATAMRSEIARNKYNNGLISFEEWDRVESEWISREQSVLARERDRVMAEADWEQLLGKGVFL